MATSTARYTAADLWQMRAPAGVRYELVAGELRTMTPGGAPHGTIAMTVGALLYEHVRANGLGRVMGADTGFWLLRDPDTVRAPDVAFISKARNPGPLSSGFSEIAPDLAVEVRSPSESRRDMDEKLADYRQTGVRLIWVIEPSSRTVTVYHGDGRTLTLAAHDVLDGADVLPGFAVPVGRLFADI
jgi:Uma2 family endonuclease